MTAADAGASAAPPTATAQPGRARFALVVLAIALASPFGLAVLSIANGAAPPVWVTLVALFVFVTIIQLGVYFPNLGVYEPVITRVEGAAVALTFDDGPHPVHTRAVLDLLDEFHAKATFFVLGNKAIEARDLVREIARRGHAIGLHGFDHDPLFCARSEQRIVDALTRTIDIVEAETGRRPTLFRPPLGFTSPRTRAASRRLGLTLVGYSARAYDGVGNARVGVTDAERAEQVARLLGRVLPRIRAGAVVLLHDAAERGDREPASAVALRPILERMRELGLRGAALGAIDGPRRP